MSMLKIRFVDDSKPAFWAMEKNFSIGKAKSNHLSLSDSSVDNLHAKIINRDDTFTLKDLGSKTGTYVNGTRITQRRIACGDTIQIGSVELEIIDPFIDSQNLSQWSLIADSSWLNGQEFPLTFGSGSPRIVLGRATNCDIVIPGTHLSRQHADLLLQDNVLQIRDLGSANGTFVNDKRVQASRLCAGDRIRLDVYSFKVFGPGISLPRAATQTLKAITEEILEDSQSEEKLWVTRSTSPGNRSENDHYKTKWPATLIAVTLVSIFIGVVGYLLFV